jgi:DNA polymerase III epsilon subunit-like protein
MFTQLDSTNYKRIVDIIDNGNPIVLLGDTETTGVSLVSKDGLFNRVLEFSLVFSYYDIKTNKLKFIKHNNKIISYTKIVNPFIDNNKSVRNLDKDVVEVHGLTLDYIFDGNYSEDDRKKYDANVLTRMAIHAPAKFDEAFREMRELLSNVIANTKDKKARLNLFFHNAEFDILFLDQEFKLHKINTRVDDIFSTKDTLFLAKELGIKSEIATLNLDSILELARDNLGDDYVDVDRDIHTSENDSALLINALNLFIMRGYNIENAL